MTEIVCGWVVGLVYCIGVITLGLRSVTLEVEVLCRNIYQLCVRVWCVCGVCVRVVCVRVRVRVVLPSSPTSYQTEASHPASSQGVPKTPLGVSSDPRQMRRNVCDCLPALHYFISTGPD